MPTTPPGWKRLPLGEVMTLQRGFDLPKSQRAEGRVPVVSSSGVSGWHSEAKVQAPGVVTGRYGTIGQVFFVGKDFWPLNTTLWVKDFKDNDPAFVARLLRTVDFHAYNDKTSVPGINRNHLHTAEVLLPPLDEQRRIAGVLDALDAYAESTRAISRRLAELVQVLFKERMTGRQDLETSDLTALAEFVNGRNFTKNASGAGQPVLRIKELRSGLGPSTVYSDHVASAEHVANHYDLLFAWSGTLGVHRWDGPSGLINQHIFKVIPRDDYPLWLVECWLRWHLGEFVAIARDKATTMGHIQRHHLKEAVVLLPSAEQVSQLHEIFGPVDRLRRAKALQGRRVEQLRDELITRLVSGRVRVADDYYADRDKPVEVGV